MERKIKHLLRGVLCCFLVSGSAWADTNLVSSGSWNDSGIWDNGLPTSTVDASIDGNFIVTAGTDVSANAANLYIGNSGTGTLNVNGGLVDNSSLCNQTYIGNTAGAIGTVSVTSGTFASRLLYVGNSGQGILTIQGGLVSTKGGVIGTDAGSRGEVTVTGGTMSNSGLTVGERGIGTLNINGGTVADSNANFSDYIGMLGGSKGTVNVTNGQWSTLQLYVGYTGTGSLNINSGLVQDITSAADVVGYASRGAVTITSGTWSNAGLILGYYDSGTGTLEMTGGVLNTASSSSQGLFVGFHGEGTLTLGGSSVINVAIGPLTLAKYAEGVGTLNLGGSDGRVGTLNVSTISGGSGKATVNFNNSGIYNFSKKLTGSLSLNMRGSGTTTLSGTHSYTGATNVTSGKLLVQSDITSSSMTTVSTGGALGGTGSVGALTVANGGILAPGTQGAGKLHAGNTAFQTGGILQLDLKKDASGSPGSDYDCLSISGSLDLSTITAGGFTVDLVAMLDDSSTFNPLDDYIWEAIIVAGGSIKGFSSEAFSIQYDKFFKGSLNGGKFSIVLDGQRLDLIYQPVPEPQTAALMLAAGGGFLLAFSRRCRVAGA